MLSSIHRRPDSLSWPRQPAHANHSSPTLPPTSPPPLLPQAARRLSAPGSALALTALNEAMLAWMQSPQYAASEAGQDPGINKLWQSWQTWLPGERAGWEVGCLVRGLAGGE